MGKITVKEAEDLIKSKVLDKNKIEDLQKRGLISKKRNSTKRFMLKGDNRSKVYPTMYFRGLGKKDTPTEEMNKLREKWTKLQTEFTKEEK